MLCAWNGRQKVALDGRRVFVDDDTWMTVPACPANVRIRGAREVHALTILFRRGMPEETLGALITPEDRLLESGEVVQSAALPFMPHLYTHDRSVTPVLLFIRRHCEMGLDDALWYEEQFAFLLERLLMRHQQVVARAHSVRCAGRQPPRDPAARSLATDFIHSNYDKPLMLGDMARAAFLSRHHFLRLFKRIHDVTPHEYLQRKRTTVARLLRGTELAVEDIVKQVGVRLALDAVPRAASVPRSHAARMPSCTGRPGVHGWDRHGRADAFARIRLSPLHDSSRCLMRSCWVFS